MSLASADRDDPVANQVAFGLARPALWRRRDGGRWLQKRAFDIGFVLAAAPFLVPLIVVLWILVKLDGGPGFYGQRRVGYGGRVFTCWKLRTMVPDADAALEKLCASDPEMAREWRETQKLKKDPRITRLGRLMRMTSLDEFPQFWNVLRGDMSIVGPRPFMQEQLELYTSIPGSEAYFEMRPGLTGLWQIHARGTSKFTDRVSYDAEYRCDQSLAYDLKIIGLTIREVLSCNGG